MNLGEDSTKTGDKAAWHEGEIFLRGSGSPRKSQLGGGNRDLKKVCRIIGLARGASEDHAKPLGEEND